MKFEYDNEIMKLNDSINSYEFQVICNTEELISVINSYESAMKYFISELYEEVIDKKFYSFCKKK